MNTFVIALYFYFQDSKRDRPSTKSQAEISNATHATFHPLKKNNSTCNLCRSINSGIWTLCLNCLKSYVQKVEAQFCCKLCDQKYIVKEFVFNHVDQIHFSHLIKDNSNIINTECLEQTKVS